MTDETIGKAAGIIWKHLNARGETVTLGSLKKLPGVGPDQAMAAVGWLAVATPPRRPPEKAIEPPGKVLLLTIDALRPDRLGLYGYAAQPTSPAPKCFPT